VEVLWCYGNGDDAEKVVTRGYRGIVEEDPPQGSTQNPVVLASRLICGKNGIRQPQTNRITIILSLPTLESVDSVLYRYINTLLERRFHLAH